MFAEYDVNMM